MCNGKRLSVLVFLLALLLAGFSWAEGSTSPDTNSSSPTSTMSTPSGSAPQTPDPSSLSSNWLMLKSELLASIDDSEKLLLLLETLQTETNEYLSLSQQLTESYKDLQVQSERERAAAYALIEAERERATRAEKRLKFWKPVGIAAIAYAAYRGGRFILTGS